MTQTQVTPTQEPNWLNIRLVQCEDGFAVICTDSPLLATEGTEDLFDKIKFRVLGIAHARETGVFWGSCTANLNDCLFIDEVDAGTVLLPVVDPDPSSRH